jgi:CHAT domain-containing protein
MGGTQVLMNAFYDRLQQPQMSKVEALRQAQLALIQSDSTSTGGDRGLVAVRWSENLKPSVVDSLSHPYYWASFIVIGNGL